MGELILPGNGFTVDRPRLPGPLPTFKYACEHHGIDALADYIADIQTNTRPIDNPARKAAGAPVKARKNDLGDAERALAQQMCDRTGPIAALNKNLTTAHATIEKAKKALAAAETDRDAVPAKLPANQIDPDAQRALLRTTRRALQMVLRLLAYNSEHWLATHLNAYLRDNHEYRAITRETILRATAGTITYTPDAITVELQRPDSPRTTRALTLLLEEINNTPPHLPGDSRPGLRREVVSSRLIRPPVWPGAHSEARSSWSRSDELAASARQMRSNRLLAGALDSRPISYTLQNP